MAELAIMYSSRLEVPPRLFTTSVTFIPGVDIQTHKSHIHTFIHTYIHTYICTHMYTWFSLEVLVTRLLQCYVFQQPLHHCVGWLQLRGWHNELPTIGCSGRKSIFSSSQAC